MEAHRALSVRVNQEDDPMMDWLRRILCHPKHPPTSTYHDTLLLLREQRSAANRATKELRHIQATGNVIADQLRNMSDPKDDKP